MRYKELVERAGVFQETSNSMLFHVTTKRRVKSIQQHGIVSTGRHRRWKNMHGGTQGDRGFIYLISDFTAAVKWAATVDSQSKHTQQIVILCIRGVPTNLLEPDPNLEGLQSPGKWFQMRGSIPPDKIVRVIPLTTEMVEQVQQQVTQTIDSNRETAVSA